MIDLDQLSLTDPSDPRTQVVVDLLSRTVYNEDAIAEVLVAARLDPGKYLPNRARLVWLAAVPDAADLRSLDDLVTRAGGQAPALANELRQRLAVLVGPVSATGPWYVHDDVFGCLFVGPRARRAMVDRVQLRGGLRELAADDYQVLVINGDSPSGKSYTWVMLQHLRDTRRLPGNHGFFWVTSQDWLTPVTGEELAVSLAGKLGLDLGIAPSAEMPETQTRKLLDAYVSQWPQDSQVRWLMLDGLDRPSATQSARDFARGMTQLVLNGELPGARLVVTGLPREGLSGGLRVRHEDIPAIDEAVLTAFLGEVAKHLGRVPADGEVPSMVHEILYDAEGKRRDLTEVEEQAYAVLHRTWGPQS